MKKGGTVSLIGITIGIIFMYAGYRLTKYANGKFVGPFMMLMGAFFLISALKSLAGR